MTALPQPSPSGRPHPGDPGDTVFIRVEALVEAHILHSDLTPFSAVGIRTVGKSTDVPWARESEEQSFRQHLATVTERPHVVPSHPIW